MTSGITTEMGEAGIPARAGDRQKQCFALMLVQMPVMGTDSFQMNGQELCP